MSQVAAGWVAQESDFGVEIRVQDVYQRVLLGSDLWKGGKEVGEVELQHGPSEDSAATLQGAPEPGLS